ncbi:MAG TPA: LuxR C-terminal-related transcriptional regulator [Xanthobacteraceae bacterium]
MSSNDSEEDASAQRIAVALLIDDEVLRGRASDAVDACSSRLARVEDSEAADVVVADHDVEQDVPAILIGDKESVVEGRRRGFAGGLLPSFSAAKLRIAIEAVAMGLACTDAPIELTPELEEEDEADGNQPELTLREAEVLRQLIAGASNKEIARRLDISVHTAKFHVASIIGKLGAHGRTDAVARALRFARAMI